MDKIWIRLDKIKKEIGKWKYGDWFGLCFLLAAAGMLTVSVRLCFADGIWYDELYTMGLTRRGFGELTALTARDVHPPFYYYYVKALQGLCRMFFPRADLTVVSKLCSVLPLLGVAVYGVTKVRRYFGMLCAGLFVFCTVSMPGLSQYSVEIRMYTLALFLVTGAFLHGYGIVCGTGRETGGGCRNADWICLTVYGILAAYTHYFACVAVAVLYACLFIYFLCQGTGRYPFWKPWLAAVACSVLAYLPWMAALVRQVAQVKESYWILPLTWRTFGSCVKFLMKPPFGSGGFQVAAAVILFLLYVGLFFYTVWKYRKNRELCFACAAGTGILAGTVLFGFAASFLIRPVFIVRYTVPAAGCFWLSFAVCAGKAVAAKEGENAGKGKKRKWFLPVLFFVFFIGIGDFRWFRNDETWRRVRMDEVKEAFALIGPEDAVVTQFNHVQGVTGYYLENEIDLWDNRPEELLCDIIENKYGTVSTPEELKNLMENGTRVWFIGNKQSELLTQWERSGIRARECQEFMLEVYWATLYELSAD